MSGGIKRQITSISPESCRRMQTCIRLSLDSRTGDSRTGRSCRRIALPCFDVTMTCGGPSPAGTTGPCCRQARSPCHCSTRLDTNHEPLLAEKSRCWQGATGPRERNRRSSCCYHVLRCQLKQAELGFLSASAGATTNGTTNRTAARRSR